MKAKVSIRKAVKKDISAMVKLWKEMIDFHRDRDRFFTRTATGHKDWIEFITGHISNEDSCVLVAECDSKIVAYCLVLISEHPPVLKIRRYGLFQDLAISANNRRHGVGERFVKKVLNWFSSRGIKRIEVRVSVHNELSTIFWRKMGFSPYIETLYLEI